MKIYYVLKFYIHLIKYTIKKNVYFSLIMILIEKHAAAVRLK